MPPHCDSLDGPVVTAARKALETSDVDAVLPFVHEGGEAEVRDAFTRVVQVRSLSAGARELADRWFFETVVRVHRAGEGAAYTGLKPAGLDVGPIIPAAEKSVAVGDPQLLVDALCGIIRREVEERHARAMGLQPESDSGVSEARRFVEANLGLQVWAHRLYKQALTGPHSHSGN